MGLAALHEALPGAAVRRLVDAIRKCLAVERLGTPAARREPIVATEEELEERVRPLLAYAALITFALVDFVVSGFDADPRLWLLLPVMLLTSLLPLQVAAQAVRNHRRRPH